MGDILHDAAFTTVEITDQLVFKNQIVIDNDMNLNVNKVYADEIIAKSFTVPDGTVYSRNVSGFDVATKEYEPDDDTEPPGFIVGGHLNEALGEQSVCLGGMYNESTGNNTATLGGRDNQASGDNAVACGQNAIATHDNTFVWNADESQPANTTMPSQFMVGCNNGLFFKLPNTTDVPAHLMPDGYGVWCWEESTHRVCMKVKRNDRNYVSYLPTLTNEIKVDISFNKDGVQQVNLLNPDLQ